MNDTQAIVSVFFDREKGGKRSTGFFDVLAGIASNDTGKENMLTSDLDL
jgi:hypothetical protein